MIDDSLSDTQPIVTQQEKKMSAEQISFECECGDKLVIKFENEELKFSEAEEFLALNRGEAHLLMLYLQEHLKEPKDDSLKGYYHCGCGMRHPKNFVCERLK